MELRDYQKQISDKGARLLTEHKICYLAMECRTGKTFTAFACAERYGAKSVLMVSKLKAIPSIKNDYEQMNPSFSLDVINYESAHKIGGRAFDLVIIDEAHSIGSFPKPSQRTKTLKSLCAQKPIIYLSGTPTPESYSQIYHQFWISSYSPFKFYSTFYKWAKCFVNVTAKMRNGTMVNDYSNAYKDRIDDAIKHLFIDFSQEEAGFDVFINEAVLMVNMSKWTEEALYRLKRDRVICWDDHSILGDTPAKLLTKLHQLSSGSVIDERGEHLITDYSKPRFILERFKGKKIAIFYVYQSEADLLRESFPKCTSSPEEFQNYKGTDLVFIGQVRSAREGVRLDTADALIFFNLEYSYLSYEQGRNRLSSKERQSPANVYFLCSNCGIEKDILDAVHSKSDFTYQYYKTKRLI